MATEKEISVVLPSDIIDVLHSVVDSGEYTSSSEVIREALREKYNKDSQDNNTLFE